MRTCFNQSSYRKCIFLLMNVITLPPLIRRNLLFPEAVCTCDDGYIVDQNTGQCTTEYLCADGRAFCLNGGACNSAGTGCDCATGYSGTNCETCECMYLYNAGVPCSCLYMNKANMLMKINFMVILMGKFRF